MPDRLVLASAIFLAASKRRTYRENIGMMFQSLIAFLQANQLTTHPLPTGDEFPVETFRLMESDLTEEGLALIRSGLDRWLKGIDAGKWPASDTSFLSTTLEAIRESKR